MKERGKEGCTLARRSLRDEEQEITDPRVIKPRAEEHSGSLRPEGQKTESESMSLTRKKREKGKMYRIFVLTEVRRRKD